jgi:rhamnosyltransferase
LTVGVIIVTYNAIKLIDSCVKSVVNSASVDKILVVNSSSTDGTIERVRELGIDLLIIDRSEFNHGKSREIARKKIGTDIVVFLTPDAILSDSTTITKLISPLINKTAAISYARQLPRPNAGFYESYSRFINYPALDSIQIRSLNDVNLFGARTFFCSNSCAAYVNEELNKVGGFRTLLTNEDYVAAYDLLVNSMRIAYVPNALVYHSHDYGLLDEFKRAFDAGYVRGILPEIEKVTGRTEKQGFGFAASLIKATLSHNLLMLPYTILLLGIRLMGYRFGKYGKYFPNSVCSLMSSQDFYWQLNKR